MFSLHGAGVGAGVAIGTAFVFNRDRPEIPDYLITSEKIEQEVARFESAIVSAREKLQTIQQKVPDDAPSEIVSFIDTHLLMLDDPLICQKPIDTIRESHCNAEKALQLQAEILISAFEKIEDSYLRSKKSDVDQVVGRVYNELLDVTDEFTEHLPGGLDGQIVITNDLTPADAITLKNRRMAAFATNLGGPISHTAILARSLRIPAIVGLHGATRYIRNGDTLVVDAHNGAILIDPDQSILEAYQERQQQEAIAQHELLSLKDVDTRSQDGVTVSLMANIELPDDINAVTHAGATGVGLYRTEFLFMNREQPPSEEEQYDAYSVVLDALPGPVVIRTLDLGADKQVDGGRAGSNTTTNPALGLRAVRLCLHDPGLFRPQLRAILRASVHGTAQIMIPMLSTLNELEQVLELLRDAKRELTREGIEFKPDIPVGGMIEVPAAAIAADLFASKLDFLSIGTNDLIQYTLAIDRVDDEVNYLYDPLHPSVLRLIHNTIRFGHEAGIPVAMCGEMAGDTQFTRLLLGMGLRTFSMDPTTLLDVKKSVLESNIAALSQATDEILATATSGELRQRVEQLNLQPGTIN